MTNQDIEVVRTFISETCCICSHTKYCDGKCVETALSALSRLQGQIEAQEATIKQYERVVEVLENLLIAQDERLNLKYSMTGRPEIGSWLWDEARTALASLPKSNGEAKEKGER